MVRVVLTPFLDLIRGPGIILYSTRSTRTRRIRFTMTVLIVSSPVDVHARAVIAKLAELRIRTELLDLSEFPNKLTLTMAYAGGQRRLQLRRPGEGQLDLDSVRAVWWRRPGAFNLPDSLKAPVHRRLALSETNTAFSGLYQSLQALWVNPPIRDAAASHKSYQLGLGQTLGLEIPDTLITSDPDEARAFWSKCNYDVIYKQFLALPDSWSETRMLSDKEIKSADATLRLAPVIFQRKITAVADVRVTIIGDEVFAAAAEVRKLDYDLDVRLNPDVKYVPHQLPHDITAKLLAFMRQLGLVYGAIDLRLTGEGRYVFLEINPAGQFLYIEQATGQPITAALAEHLATGRRE
jgi:glutathione synthase/RimK-type ligase-like ATP-grasp enzyme